MSKTLVPKDISDHPLANALEPVLNEVLENQTWFQRRKNTIFAVAQGVVQVANLSFFIVGDLPWQVALAIGLVAFLAEAVLHSRTKGPLTVSSAQKVVDQVTRDARKHFEENRVPVWHVPRDQE